MRDRLRLYVKQIKVLNDNNFTLHDIRRLKITKTAQGKGLEKAQKEMKHSSKRITMNYIRKPADVKFRKYGNLI